jgi:hypothetical protein
MTELPSSSRWLRFLPKQFSIRFLLVIVAIAAGVSWLFVYCRNGHVTERQVLQLSLEMPKSQVLTILGKPLQRELVTNGEVWHYRIYDPDTGESAGGIRLFVEGGTDKTYLMHHQYLGKPIP